MRKNTYSVFDQFLNTLQEYANSSEFLAKSVVFINSTLQTINRGYMDFDIHKDYKIILNSCKKSTLIRLSVISYFIDENLGVPLREALITYSKNNSDLTEIVLICKNKYIMKSYFSFILQVRGANYLLNNFLDKNNWKDLEYSFRIKRIRNFRIPKDKKPPVRFVGVGYKDKHPLPKNQLNLLKLQMSTRAQVEKEERLILTEDTALLLEGFLL